MEFHYNQPNRELRVTPDNQDRNCDAWFQLLALIDRAAADKRTVFSPRIDLGEEIWSQISVLPKTIAKLTSVKELKLGDDLTRIPPEIGEMIDLEVFIPRINYCLHWFPYEITNCTKLKDSGVSTRALYGSYSHRTIFPDLKKYPVTYFDTPLKCSICDRTTSLKGFEQYWVSKRVATDVLPLLATICSETCFSKLHKGGGLENYLSFPHQGGKDLLQPQGDSHKYIETIPVDLVQNNSMSHFRPSLDRGDFYQLKGKELCWFLLEPIIYFFYKATAKKKAIASLSSGQKALYYWWYLDSYGFKQFLNNGYYEHIPRIIEGMNVVGNQPLKELLEGFIQQVKKEGLIYTIEDSLVAELAETYFFELKENDCKFIEKYIRKHPDDFLANEDDTPFSNYKEGTSKTYFPSGGLKNHFSIKDKLLHGVFKIYSPNGALLKKENYEKGVLKDYVHYRKNDLKEKEEKIHQFGKIKIEYSPKGNKNEEIHYNTKGEKHGLSINWYYDSDNLSSIERYKQGKKIGVHHKYYREGGKEATYTNDYPRKMINFWDKSGKQTVKEGEGYTIYRGDKSGKIEKSITEYKNGMPNGSSITYLDDKIISYKTLKNGEYHGEWKEYNEEGQLTQITIFENGREISRQILNEKDSE